jgi:negative regulator of flagellin synthesis FlgM
MSIERVNNQDAARAYVQSTDATRAAGASTAGVVTQQASKAAQQSQAQTADSVTLSDSARSLAAARDAVQNAPDVREQKVAEIKQHVDSGTYEVPASVLARKMLEASNSEQT